MNDMPKDIEMDAGLEELLTASEHLLFRMDLVRGGFDYISPKAETIYGCSKKVLHERGLELLLTKLFDPDDAVHFRNHIFSLCKAAPGQTIKTTIEYRLRNADGVVVWLSNSMSLVSDERGRPVLATGVTTDVTARRQSELAVRESEEKYRLSMDALQIGVFVVEHHSFRFSNPALCRMFGYTAEEFARGMGPADVVAPEHHQQLIEHIKRRVAGEKVPPYELIGVRKDGTRFPMLVSGEAIVLGGRVSSVGTLLDLTAQREAEKSIRLSARVFESSQEAILLTDAKSNIVSVNSAFCELTGYSSEEVLGRNPRLLSSGRHQPDFFTSMWQSIDYNDKWQGEVWNRKKNGDFFPVWLRINVYRDPNGSIQNYVGIATDISERLAAQEHIRQLAYFDVLTGLPNRRMLEDRAVQALVAAERDSNAVTLMFIDLDQFKKVNDSLGHSAGDTLLGAVAIRILDCVRRVDTVARLGGDEFVVLLPKTDDDGAVEVARKILAAVALPVRLGVHELSVTPSIGISVFPQDGRDFETLLKHADTAMYHAKESGRNAYRFFAAAMNVAAFDRLLMENNLRHALERDEFVLYYQPLVDVADGRIVGAEALIRWQHPKDGLLMPGSFIHVAEVSGLIIPIGEWVLREACRQNQQWHVAGLPKVSIAVNISAVQFRGDQCKRFESAVRSILEHCDIAAGCLELELTEGILMDHTSETIATLDRLSGLGVKLSIDDFGTGYSSLSYLKRFPLDKLKIDQSFVRDIVVDADDWAIATAIISMGHSLRLKVIAEGVEVAEQLDMLTEQGCDEVQGYHFSRPVPAEEFAELLRRQPYLKES